jgi:hypothetical protein
MTELRKKVLSRFKAQLELALCHLNTEEHLTEATCQYIAEIRCVKAVYDHYFEILDGSWFDESSTQSKLAYATHMKGTGVYMEVVCNFYKTQLEATGSDLYIYSIAMPEYLPVLWSRTKLGAQEAATVIRALGGKASSIPAGNYHLMCVDANVEIELFKEKLNGCHSVNQFFADDVL